MAGRVGTLHCAPVNFDPLRGPNPDVMKFALPMEDPIANNIRQFHC